MRSTLLTTCAVSMALALSACEPEPTSVSPAASDAPAEVLGGAIAPALLPIEDTLNTYISDYIQIDYCPDECSGDANLFADADPADGSPSFDNPPGGSDYIDWDDLAATIDDHKYSDVNPEGGKDSTAFPRSNSCVGEAMVLSKMDLTYVGAANNSQWGYFIAQRSANNGDSAYYWLITRDAPTKDDGTDDCRPSEYLLTYDISGPDASSGAAGDLLLMGHFHSSETQLRVFRAVDDFSGVEAKDALDYHDTDMWEEVIVSDPYDPEFVVAVNITETRAGAWGDDGVKDSDGTDLEEEIIAELAIDMTYIVGDQVCGGEFYGSVITRSSASGDMSPDMKDLAGPFALRMRTVEPASLIEPDCESLHYSAWDEGGLTLDCEWEFTNGTDTLTATGCEGDLAVGPGEWTGTVTMSDPDSGCAADDTSNTIVVGGPVTADADLSDTCALEFEYGVTVDGDMGDLTYSWAFEDSSPALVGASSAQAGTWVVAAADTYTGTVEVVDTRTWTDPDGVDHDYTCPGYDSDTVDVLPVLAVDPTLTGSCEETYDYAANVTGGDGIYDLVWTCSDGAPTGDSGTVDLGTQPTGGVEVTCHVDVTDSRDSTTVCEVDGDADPAWVYSPIQLDIDASSLGMECEAVESGDAVTWTADLSGGTGLFTYNWTPDACDGATSCTIDPADSDQCVEQDVSLTVEDAGVCDDESSETEHYSKYTVVTATDL